MKTLRSIEVVGSSGQISLGKEYADRTVVIEQIKAGAWQEIYRDKGLHRELVQSKTGPDKKRL